MHLRSKSKGLSEEKLIQDCCLGDRRAMQVLYERYAPGMMSVCYRYVNDRAIAQDLLHDGFLIVFSKIGDFRGEGSFEGWMRRVFVTTALGYLRKTKKHQETDYLDQAVLLTRNQVSALDRLSSEEILDCISRLPEGYRTVLNLFAIEGYSHREIAGMLGISEGTSRSQYARAKASLLKTLKELEII